MSMHRVIARLVIYLACAAAGVAAHVFSAVH